jgi:hypothetical protein
MRINSSRTNYVQQRNKPAFTSKPLFDVNIRKLDQSGEKAHLVPAQIVEFFREDKSDKIEIKRLLKDWNDTAYAKDIASDFLDKDYERQFLGVKTNDNKEIVSLAEVFLCPYRKFGNIITIQAAPNAEHNRPSRQYKGAGEVITYGINKLAQNTGVKELSVISSSNDVYWQKIIGMSPLNDPWNGCVQNSKGMREFMGRVKTKYKIP